MPLVRRIVVRPPMEQFRRREAGVVVRRRQARCTGWSGVNVCTITRPPRGPRPARPATCDRSWNVRSAERKSGTCSPTSALTTPTSVTLGKSSPLAIICVPIRMWISPSRNAASTRPWLPGPPHRVAVHAPHDVVREHLLDLRLQFLRAESLVAHRRLAAQRAVLRRRLLVAAVVAEHHVALLVVRQAQVAEAARSRCGRTTGNECASRSRGG